MGARSTWIACGILVAPVFYLVVVAQILTRNGFDPRVYPLSLLSLGAAGWIQVANFLVTGALAIACAAGLAARRREEGRSGALRWLIALFGIGMIIAGLAPSDPLPGFPPGTSAMPARMSVHAMLHGLGFAVAFLSLIVACFVASRRFRRVRRSGWSVYSAATGVATIVLIAIGFSIRASTAIAFFVVGLIALGWLSAVSWRWTVDAAREPESG